MHRTPVGQNQESAEYRLIEINIGCVKMHRTPVGQNCQQVCFHSNLSMYNHRENAPNPGGAKLPKCTEPRWGGLIDMEGKNAPDPGGAKLPKCTGPRWGKLTQSTRAEVGLFH